MQKYFIIVACITLLPLSNLMPAYATDAVDELLAEYRLEEGVENFDAETGKAFWVQEFTHEKTGKIRQCSTCHTEDLRNEGKHARTGKPIKPLAPSVNPERLMDIKKIRKWLKRNCKWTLGRECSSQEKGDVLSFIQTQ